MVMKSLKVDIQSLFISAKTIKCFHWNNVSFEKESMYYYAHLREFDYIQLDNYMSNHQHVLYHYIFSTRYINHK